MVGHRQRVAIAAVAKFELAPRLRAGRPLKSAYHRSFGAVPAESGVPVARWRGRPMRLTRPAIKHRMDAPGRKAHVPGKPPDQKLADTRVKPGHKPCVHPNAACRA